jgi:hypothetical protein
MGKMVIRAYDKRVKPIPRIHPVVDGSLRILILGYSGQRFTHPASMGINNRTGHSVYGGTEFDIPRAPEHGARSASQDIQVITLNPELINVVRNLESQRNFIRLH